MADGDDHVFLLDQVFIILIDKLIRDLGTAVIGQSFTGSGQFLQHHIIHARRGSEDIEIIGDLVGKLAGFLGKLLPLHAGQALQSQFKDGTRLCFGQLVVAIHHLMAWIINQPDEGLYLICRPGFFTKLVAGGLGIRRALDQLNDLVDRGQCHHQASQHMGTVARLAKKMD